MKTLKVSITLLPTKRKINIGEFAIQKMNDVFTCGIKTQESDEILDIINYDMYLTSEDEIKIGDWTIDISKVYQHGNLCKIDTQYELDSYTNDSKYKIKKIVASTNPVLSNLPLIPISFIKEYCENSAEEGMLELDFELIDFEFKKYFIKQNSITGECYINRCKTSWNKDEVFTLMKKAIEFHTNTFNPSDIEWIESQI